MQLDNPFTEIQIAEIYSKYNKNYHNYKNAIDSFIKLVPFESQILEIGVGLGTFTKLLLSSNYQVIGIDKSKEMLKLASKEIQKISERCDLLNYESFKNYDVIVSHSGGFTFKRGKFETYYREQNNLELALKKVYNFSSNNFYLFYL